MKINFAGARCIMHVITYHVIDKTKLHDTIYNVYCNMYIIHITAHIKQKRTFLITKYTYNHKHFIMVIAKAHQELNLRLYNRNTQPPQKQLPENITCVFYDNYALLHFSWQLFL